MLGSAHDVLMFSACTCSVYCSEVPAGTCKRPGLQHARQAGTFLHAAVCCSTPLQLIFALSAAANAVWPIIGAWILNSAIAYCVQPLHTVLSYCIAHCTLQATLYLPSQWQITTDWTHPRYMGQIHSVGFQANQLMHHGLVGPLQQ